MAAQTFQIDTTAYIDEAEVKTGYREFELTDTDKLCFQCQMLDCVSTSKKCLIKQAGAIVE